MVLLGPVPPKAKEGGCPPSPALPVPEPKPNGVGVGPPPPKTEVAPAVPVAAKAEVGPIVDDEGNNPEEEGPRVEVDGSPARPVVVVPVVSPVVMPVLVRPGSKVDVPAALSAVVFEGLIGFKPF